MLSAVIGGVGLFFVLTGGSVIAGNVEAGSPAAVWIGGALIVVGVACWVVEGVLSSDRQAAARLSSRSPIGAGNTVTTPTTFPGAA